MCVLIFAGWGVEWIAEGCAILGTGGGGSSYPPFLMSRQALREGKEILVRSSYSLTAAQGADRT